MSAFEDGMAIAQALADLEVEHDLPMNNPLHQALRAGLISNADALGLTDEQIAEIEGVGPSTPAKKGAAHPRGGGTPKDPQ